MLVSGLPISQGILNLPLGGEGEVNVSFINNVKGIEWQCRMLHCSYYYQVQEVWINLRTSSVCVWSLFMAKNSKLICMCFIHVSTNTFLFWCLIVKDKTWIL